MLRPLRNAALTASREPDGEADSCQWRGSVAQARPANAWRNERVGRAKTAGNGRKALLDTAGPGIA